MLTFGLIGIALATLCVLGSLSSSVREPSIDQSGLRKRQTSEHNRSDKTERGRDQDDRRPAQPVRPRGETRIRRCHRHAPHLFRARVRPGTN